MRKILFFRVRDRGNKSMGIIVQKYGGTSLIDAEHRSRCIEHIRTEKELGNQVVIVVSAMGRLGDPYATDTLISILEDAGKWLPKRELDLLLSTGEIISAVTLSNSLWKLGIGNKILTGAQAGITTNDRFNNAMITSIEPKKILAALAGGLVVIVPGFQGQTVDGDITTLGRGGSDTTATALGVALDADYVDIFTDVNGIMTADPRIVEEAVRLDHITYTETCNLAHLGAKVIHPRAVEMAMQKNIPIRVRSTTSFETGTLITNVNEGIYKHSYTQRLITGVTQVPYITQIKVHADLGQYDLQLQVFNAMAANNISIDFINVNPMGVIYTVADQVAEKAESILLEMGYNPVLTPHCAKVSVVGAGMAGIPGVMANIVEALVEEDIQILQSADSHTTIWVLVQSKDMVKAVRAIHKKFDLHLV